MIGASLADVAQRLAEMEEEMEHVHDEVVVRVDHYGKVDELTNVRLQVIRERQAEEGQHLRVMSTKPL